MKIAGFIALAIGLMLGIYAIGMSTSIYVPAKDLGYGMVTQAMTVSNVGLMAQQQSYLIFSGILSVVGAILSGFGMMAPRPPALPVEKSKPMAPTAANPEPPSANGPTSVSICPKCRYMGDGDALVCARCEAPLGL